MLAVVLLFSSAASFSVGPVGTQPVLRRMPARAAAPSLFLGKLFKKGEDGDAEPSKPAPAASAPKKGELSATDKILVQFGMKTEDECEVVEEGEDLMEQIKCAGRAGIISYIIWEWIFWLTAIPGDARGAPPRRRPPPLLPPRVAPRAHAPPAARSRELRLLPSDRVLA